MTAPGWARAAPSPGARERVRARLGVGEQTLVAGIVGSIVLNRRNGYAYGVELVRAIRRVERADVAVCIVGDGTGLATLEELAGEDLGRRVLLTGRIPPEDVPDHLAAFDLASLPQSTDGVGSFRFTTKLPEYLAAGLPIVTGEIPAAYDLDQGQMIRLAGHAPWSEEYVAALAGLLENLKAAELAPRRAAAQRAGGELFDLQSQRERVRAFLGDIVASRSRAAPDGQSAGSEKS
jgi:glycosyltransferase involved in cell wall biosynthesis